LQNTAVGFQALYNNISGANNIAVGLNAGYNIGDFGERNNIDIGNLGVSGDFGTIRIGSIGDKTQAFIAGIRGVTTGNGDAIPVLIDSDGQLGTMSSSRRFKSEIKAMDNASETIHALKPVTFHYKSDKTGTPQFGLIAEEVAQVSPDLVVRGADGEIYTVRYDAVNAMLLNEFLKEHRKNRSRKRPLRASKSKLKRLLRAYKR
jgi:ribosomal protein S15P/S13E